MSRGCGADERCAVCCERAVGRVFVVSTDCVPLCCERAVCRVFVVSTGCVPLYCERAVCRVFVKITKEKFQLKKC